MAEHAYQGLCPDVINGPDSRDAECEACLEMDRLSLFVERSRRFWGLTIDEVYERLERLERAEARIAALEAENFSLRATLDGEPCNEDWRTEAADMSQFAGECMDERDAGRVRSASLEAALRPLLNIGIHAHWPDDEPMTVSTILVGDIRRARALLAPPAPAEGGKEVGR